LADSGVGNLADSGVGNLADSGKELSIKYKDKLRAISFEKKLYGCKSIFLLI